MADHLLSDLAGGGGGIRSVQQGDLDNEPTTNGTSPQDVYVDVTITAVLDITKCFVIVNASGAVTTGVAGYYANATSNQSICRGKLTSTTNLRVYAVIGQFFEGSWQVVEFT